MEATIDHRNFEWTCHVCLKNRPNDKISVARHRHIYPSGVEMSQHVRYCNDDPVCEHLARHHDHTGISLLWARDELATRSGIVAIVIAAMFGLAFGVLWTLLVINGFGWL